MVLLRAPELMAPPACPVGRCRMPTHRPPHPHTTGRQARLSRHALRARGSGDLPSVNMGLLCNESSVRCNTHLFKSTAVSEGLCWTRCQRPRMTPDCSLPSGTFQPGEAEVNPTSTRTGEPACCSLFINSTSAHQTLSLAAGPPCPRCPALTGWRDPPARGGTSVETVAGAPGPA